MRKCVLVLSMLVTLQAFSLQAKAQTATKTVRITIKEPRSNGGAPITGYYIEQREQYSDKWVRVLKDPFPYVRPIFTYVLRADFKHVDYFFRARAINKFGISEPSEPDYALFSDPKNTEAEVFLLCKDGASARSKAAKTSKTEKSPYWSFEYLDTREAIPVPYKLKD